jgi:hypothetical protein
MKKQSPSKSGEKINYSKWGEIRIIEKKKENIREDKENKSKYKFS